MRKRKILIISGEAWREESNGGNVLSNLFDSFKEDFEFAQIYTNPALPSNSICTHYFHLSESEMFRAVLTRRKWGRVLSPAEINTKSTGLPKTKESLSFVRKYFLNTAFFLQDILWRVSKWKNSDLENFIKDFGPDIIFAPMYYGLHLHRLDRYAAELTGKKIISYVSDDHLTLKQFSLSPIYWLNRLILRKNVFSTSKYYDLLYTMTQEQLDEYLPVLKVPMKVLKKTGDFTVQPIYMIKNEHPLIITYGGNLIYNRYKTLGKLAETIRIINKDGIRAVLHIYTQTPITEEFNKLLSDGQNTFLLGKISMDELEKKYRESDIVLHVESFDLKQRLLTRLSFSTKIVDLLHSARCIMAICWKESSPYKYLKTEDAAVCVDDLEHMESKLKYLIDNPNVIREYAQKAWECGKRNHEKTRVIADFRNDIESLIT